MAAKRQNTPKTKTRSVGPERALLAKSEEVRISMSTENFVDRKLGEWLHLLCCQIFLPTLTCHSGDAFFVKTIIMLPGFCLPSANGFFRRKIWREVVISLPSNLSNDDRYHRFRARHLRRLESANIPGLIPELDANRCIFVRNFWRVNTLG